MKKELINTGIIVPSKRSYYYSGTDENFTEFTAKMATALKMPDNWKEYFKFSSSDSFVILTDKDWYKSQNFRRFKRGKEAVIDSELLEAIKDHIEYTDSKNNREQSEHEKFKYFIELIRETAEANKSDEFSIVYSKNTGVEITLKEPGKESYMSCLAKCFISHSGKITEPTFDAHFGSYAAMPISKMQAWIDLNTPLSAKILEKANKIKSELPEEFFIKETVS